jgi:hypothetical protein
MTVTDNKTSDRYGARRWWVHLGLIGSAGLALLVLLQRPGLTVHVLAGSCFAVLAGVHLAQRRRTLLTLGGNLVRPARWPTRRGRLSLSAAVLIFLAANVIVSGVVDWLTHRTVMVSVRPLTGIPLPPLNWHTSTSLILVVYLVVHVVRRWARLRHSRIR